jgi:SAM-dependent methyltransferase
MTMTRVLVGTGSLSLVAFGVLLYATFGAFLPWREAGEANRLLETVGIRPGMTVAEIGAGTGRFTVAAAGAVGSAGIVYSTELSAANRDAVRARATAARLRNVVVVAAEARLTNLPDGCCDVVFLRNVYHHIADPETFARGLRSAVRPGGRVAIIDFEPGALWLHGARPADSSARRPGHGVSRSDTIAELTSAGFRVVRDVADWSGPMWLVVFERGKGPG